MDLDEYQDRAIVFAKYEFPDYPLLGLLEEAGEVSGKVAKYCRKEKVPAFSAISAASHPINSKEQALREDLLKELGDVLWQLSACCSSLGMTLNHVAQANLDKLEDRDARGVLIGIGDDR